MKYDFYINSMKLESVELLYFIESFSQYLNSYTDLTEPRIIFFITCYINSSRKIMKLSMLIPPILNPISFDNNLNEEVFLRLRIVKEEFSKPKDKRNNSELEKLREKLNNMKEGLQIKNNA